jgi:hypothetical protein
MSKAMFVGGSLIGRVSRSPWVMHPAPPVLQTARSNSENDLSIHRVG